MMLFHQPEQLAEFGQTPKDFVLRVHAEHEHLPIFRADKNREAPRLRRTPGEEFLDALQEFAKGP